MLLATVALHGQTDSIVVPSTGTVSMLGTYYADRFVGRKTSNGEIFRQNQYTAAHKSIPLGTYLLVTYPATGQQVVVRVNDRCPKKGVLDMTKLAVFTLGIKGSGKVLVEPLDPATGYGLWVAQDTLAMSREQYLAFRDKSNPKRISPYPIGPYKTNDGGDGSPAVASVRPTKPSKVPKPKAKATESDSGNDSVLPPTDAAEEAQADTLAQKPQGPLYDIELCISGSRAAALRESTRIPAELQDKVIFDEQSNRQVRVILSLADSRSHAVRTQAMLLDLYPDCYLIPHQD